MTHPFIYVGCFVDFSKYTEAISGIRTNALKNNIREPHITFEYKPKNVDQSLFGKEISIRIIGYGNDGKNEGLRVQLYSFEPRIQAMIERIETPHITIAVSEDGKPVNTKLLHFDDIMPIEIIGRYGGYAKSGKVII